MMGLEGHLDDAPWQHHADGDGYDGPFSTKRKLRLNCCATLESHLHYKVLCTLWHSLTVESYIRAKSSHGMLEVFTFFLTVATQLLDHQ